MNKGGRPPVLTKAQEQEIVEKYLNEGLTINELADIYKCSYNTVLNRLRDQQIDTSKPHCINYVGYVFHTKIITGLARKDESGCRYWYWTCQQCGRTGVSNPIKFKRKCITCFNKETTKRKLLISYYPSAGWLPRAKYNEMVRSAKERDIKWDLTPEFLWSLYLSQSGKCALSGRPIELNKPGTDVAASLDRIDSDGDYTEDNVWWIFRDYQFMKWTYPIDYFIKSCKEVVNHQRKGRPSQYSRLKQSTSAFRGGVSPHPTGPPNGIQVAMLRSWRNTPWRDE